jgi:hypothetical protein
MVTDRLSGAIVAVCFDATAIDVAGRAVKEN